MSTRGAPPDDRFGAFCRDNHIAIAATGAGPLDGTRFGVKDVFDLAGTRTGFGNPDWLASHAPATRTAAVVERLLAAGATLAGRTLSDELTYSLTGENVHYGTPVNPAAPERVPGGSSSGSAVAVAGGLVDFALGTDCGGSIRLPASYCGVIGLRPSHGRVTVDGVIPFAPSFDVVGWFARDMTLMSAVGEVLLGRDLYPPKPPRLLRAEDAFTRVAPAVSAALAPAEATLGRLFGPARSLTVADPSLAAWCDVFRVVQGAEIWRERRAWVEATRPRIGQAVRERLDWAATLDAESVAGARAEHARIRQRLDALLAPGDILYLPSSPRAAPARNEALHTLEIEYRHQAMCLLCIAGLGGLPQISLPLARVDGLPLGLSLVGARGTDRMLLEYASLLMARALADAA